MFVRNRVLNYLLALLAAVAMPVYAQTLFDINNATSVQQAVDAIKTTLEGQGRRIVATINHSGAAAGVGLSLRDTQLVIFSDPHADALSIARSRTFGIDLPNKLLVWQNAAGKIRVTSNPVSYLAERHRVRLLDPLLERMQRAQGQFDRDKGLVTVESSQSLDATVAAIRAAIQRAGLNSLLIDHAANAKAAQISLPPTQLILFGNPRVGTPLMQDEQQIGIDLPLKFLVWASHDGRVLITYNDPAFLAKRHDIQGLEDVLAGIANTLKNLANAGATALPQ